MSREKRSAACSRELKGCKSRSDNYSYRQACAVSPMRSERSRRSSCSYSFAGLTGGCEWAPLQCR